MWHIVLYTILQITHTIYIYIYIYIYTRTHTHIHNTSLGTIALIDPPLTSPGAMDTSASPVCQGCLIFKKQWHPFVTISLPLISLSGKLVCQSWLGCQIFIMKYAVRIGSNPSETAARYVFRADGCHRRGTSIQSSSPARQRGHLKGVQSWDHLNICLFHCATFEWLRSNLSRGPIFSRPTSSPIHIYIYIYILSLLILLL